jgi:hypothetical protein
MLMPNRLVAAGNAAAHSRRGCLVGQLGAHHVVLIENSYTSRRTTQGKTFTIVWAQIELNQLIETV